jgi:DNA-binding NtrC family response regulator
MSKPVPLGASGTFPVLDPPPRILLVDDEPRLVEAMSRLLGDWFDIVTATSPADAIAALWERGPFEVIVSDMWMPEMDGLQLLAAASTVAPDTTRLLLTGEIEGAPSEAHAQGLIAELISKPVAARTLRQALLIAVMRHRQRAAEAAAAALDAAPTCHHR